MQELKQDAPDIAAAESEPVTPPAHGKCVEPLGLKLPQ